MRVARLCALVLCPVAALLTSGCRLKRPAPMGASSSSSPPPVTASAQPASGGGATAAVDSSAPAGPGGVRPGGAEPAAAATAQEEIHELLVALKRQQEEAALATVRSIAAAEDEHQQAEGAPADLAGLIEAGRAEAELGEGKGGYVFAAWTVVTAEGAAGWVAVANAIEPGESGDRGFAATSAGVLFARPAARPFGPADWSPDLAPPSDAELLGEWREGALAAWKAGEAARAARAAAGPEPAPQPAPQPAKDHADPSSASPLAAARQQLTHEDAAQRRAGAEALAALGPGAAEAVPDLARLVHDPEWEVRRAAVQALGAVGAAHDGVLSALAAALEDERPEVRRAAYEALDQ